MKPDSAFPPLLIDVDMVSIKTCDKILNFTAFVIHREPHRLRDSISVIRGESRNLETLFCRGY